MSVEPIKVSLCGDHFERLIEGSVCDKCPSRAENKSMVLAMAQAMNADDLRGNRFVVTELSSIRRALDGYNHRLSVIEDKIMGNGRSGIDHRVTVLEARAEANRQTWATYIALAGVVLSSLLAFFALLRT